MPDRKTGLSMSAFNLMTGAYIGDLINVTMTVRNKTQEGKGITDIDDFPVLAGRMWEAQAELNILASAGTIPLMGTATSSTPAGTIGMTTGPGSYSGTAVITEAVHRISREEIQTFSVTLTGRGSVAYAGQ